MIEYKIIFFIYLLGIIILVGAILLNYIGILLGFNSWYDIFFKGIKNTSILNWVWLLVIYPLVLGILGHYGLKFLK
jgi:hypothetical protein